MEVPVPSQRLGPFEDVIGAERFAEVRGALAALGSRGRPLIQVNSTAHGGGVAEMLASLIGYERAEGVDARWMVVPGRPEFFAITKRIHNRLHGHFGDGGPLGPDERREYDEVLAPSAEALTAMLRPGDPVMLHDPQTAGLIRPLKRRGAIVIWRSHVGVDAPDDVTRSAWDFLRPDVEEADAYVFSRDAFVWEGLDPELVRIIPPVIDAFSPKNQHLSGGVVWAILEAAGLLVEADAVESPAFLRLDGSSGVVSRRAVVEGGPVPIDAPWVTQVSRWDRLKDPVGVLVGFTERVARVLPAHLVLAGPSMGSVDDDPEGAGVLAEVLAAREGVEPALRERVHVVQLPMEDGDENGAIVNAIQRHSSVVVQKSVAEGFGLTVTEALWKARPVVASQVGGIQDQIEDGRSGILVDPVDLDGFGDTVAGLLFDKARADAMGIAARDRVIDRYLAPRSLLQEAELVTSLLEDRPA